MVYVPYSDINKFITGIVAERETGQYVGLLILEAIFGLLVVLSNAIIIAIFVIGWVRLMKNKFYFVLANLILCTSLKAFVEVSFILPYYVLQKNKVMHGEYRYFGYFSRLYERVIFNVSVFADYGILFFSVLIAINRYLSFSRKSLNFSKASNDSTSKKTVLSCVMVWCFSATIPVFFFLFNCQYVYYSDLNLYVNECLDQNDGHKTENGVIQILISCLINISYACAVLVFVLYIVILVFLRRQRNAMHDTDVRKILSNTQIQLLLQSILVFALYAASICSVFAISFVKPGKTISPFEIAYIENLLNLSIAAVYPICFLALSGEMRRYPSDIICSCYEDKATTLDDGVQRAPEYLIAQMISEPAYSRDLSPVG